MHLRSIVRHQQSRLCNSEMRGKNGDYQLYEVYFYITKSYQAVCYQPASYKHTATLSSDASCFPFSAFLQFHSNGSCFSNNSPASIVPSGCLRSSIRSFRSAAHWRSTLPTAPPPTSASIFPATSTTAAKRMIPPARPTCSP